MPKPFADSIRLRDALGLMALLLAVVALVIAAAAALVQLWHMQDSPESIQQALKQRASVHLETAPQTEMDRYLAEKRKLTDGYAWIDRSKGLVRIPVDMAMQAMAARDASTKSKTTP